MFKRQNAVNSFSAVTYSGSLGQYFRLVVGIFSTVVGTAKDESSDSVWKELFSVMVAVGVII